MMNTDELFIDGHKLPKPLQKEELYNLIQQSKDGSKEARNKIIIHNIKLVLYEVTSKFKNVDYDKKELVSIGNIGLIKATDTYDMSKGINFSTYAVRCIDNEILMFLRKLKKNDNVDSLDKVVFRNKDGKKIKLSDQLSDDRDIVEENENAEIHRIIREVVKNLPERDREIIMLYFGFYNDQIYTQREIADKMNISSSYVSRLINKIVKKIEKNLEFKDIIELHSNHSNSRKESEEQMSRLQTIYEYFKNYTKEQIDEMLIKLTEEEKALVTIRYGEDLNNPVSTKLTKEQTDKFYGSLVPKMKRLLSNPTGKRKPRQRKVKAQQLVLEQPIGIAGIITDEISEKNSDESQESLKVEAIPAPSISTIIQEKTEKLEQVEEELIPKTIATQEQSKEQTPSNNEVMTKEDCVKILELLRTPSFSQMMSTLSVKEAVIISLKLGYIDDKYFSTESISEFLGIDPSEVIETTKKVLLVYKDSINNFLDNAIAIATDEVGKTKHYK